MSSQQQPANDSASGLSSRDASILDFEREWWRHAGAKEEAIRSQFSLSTARYYQVLNAVIDLPAAVRHDPMLVGRLQRARDARTSSRAARAFSSSDTGAAAHHDEETTY
ncbi:MAG: DUF3263 domain-containing protein [Rhodoglobus sp.]